MDIRSGAVSWASMGLVALILVGGFSGCDDGEEEEVRTVIVAMVTDVAGLGDASLNDGVYAGLRRFQSEADNVELRVVESEHQSDYLPNLLGLSAEGAQVVFSVGLPMGDAMMESAKESPDTYFAGIDVLIDEERAPENVRGILFKQQESGYLAGVVAGLLTKEYAWAMDQLNERNVVGMVLGMDIPSVERYQAGFYAGVRSVNADCRVLSVVAGSFTDQDRGRAAAETLVGQGADVIFHIAGEAGLGAIRAAREAGVLAIGVDVDQHEAAPDTVVTSAVKGVAEATYLTIKDVLEGRFSGGVNVTYGIEDDAVGIAPFGLFEDLIPQAVKDAVGRAITDMKAGKTVVPATRKAAGYSG